MDQITTFLKQLLQHLTQYTRRFISWWKNTFQSQSGTGKIILVSVSLIVACCLCFVPIVILLPSGPDYPEQAAEPLAGARETEMPLPTSPPATDTSAPPTETPPPPSYTPPIMCTPPACQEDEVYYCPDDCPYGCGTTCATVTPTLPEGQVGQVVGIIDGGTIEVDIAGTVHAVRYLGVEAPGQGLPYSQESAQASADLVLGQTVNLVEDVSVTDSSDYLLRYVYLPDGTFVNAQLIQGGYARVAADPPVFGHLGDFQGLEQEARRAGLGLWSEQVTAPTATQPPPEPTQPPQPTQAPLPTATQAPVVTGSQVVIVAVNKRDEYVDIRNDGPQPQDLSGWTLLSEKGDQRCALGGVIDPGATLRIWAMAEDAGQGGFNCNFGSNIWNNSESDPAVLFDDNGTAVSRYP